MVDFKSLVEAIHNAIVQANVNLMDQHEALLDKYFTESPSAVPGSDKTTLTPKTVIVELPQLFPGDDDNATVKVTEIQVPLITLVPLSLSQIEKATISVDFEMDVVDGELKVDFSNKKQRFLSGRRNDPKLGKIEITLSPEHTPEGVKLLVEAYERVIKNQMA